MGLDERKLAILAAIVEWYIRTGEPVGSHTLTQLLGISVSSATIRNDMAVLFELGLLEQPHTSAGRIPSHLGYRVYLDGLLNQKPLSKREKDEIDSFFNVRNPDPDRLLQDSAKALADITNCAAISTAITPKSVCVKKIELIAATERTVVILLIATNGVIKNKVCRVDFLVTPQICQFFTDFANGCLSGKTLDEISVWYINSVSITLGEYAGVFNPLLAAIYELCKEINDGQFFVHGSTNLLSYKELADIAPDILLLLTRQKDVMNLLPDEHYDLAITIGKENNHLELIQSSVVFARYNIGKYRSGAIGIIGPIRMDYAKVLPRLEYFAQTLGRLLSETFEQQ